MEGAYLIIEIKGLTWFSALGLYYGGKALSDYGIKGSYRAVCLESSASHRTMAAALSTTTGTRRAKHTS